MEHQARTNADVASRLASALDEREAQALFIRLLPEVALATTQERMRLLAHALAGLHRPDLASEMRSRVTRAIMQLEPSDVVELRKLDAAERSPGTHPAPMMTPEREPLIVAGCVLDRSMFAGNTLSVSRLGRALLSTLETWSPL